MEELLRQLREAGWRVAVHNDYTLEGDDMTFWLLTRHGGWYVKGEGRTDVLALRQCVAQAQKFGFWLESNTYQDHVDH